MVRNLLVFLLNDLYSYIHIMRFLEILQHLKQNNFDKKELNELAKSFFKIALKIVNYKIKDSLPRKYFGNYSDTCSEIANDAISPLFEPSKGGSDLSIIRSLNSWKYDITNEAEADFFVNKVIWKRVSQTITKKIKETDPVFARIHHNLSNTIKKYDYKKTTYYSTIYIVKDLPFIKIKPLFSEDHFEEIPIQIFAERPFHLLDKLFAYIIKDGRFQPAIPMNLLVKKIKALQSEYSETDKSMPQDSIEYRININEAVELASSGIKNILNKYVKDDKISPEDYRVFNKLFEQLSIDLLNGGIQGSLYFYMSEQKEDLSRNLFYETYHRKLNYLYNKYMSSIKKVLNFDEF